MGQQEAQEATEETFAFPSHLFLRPLDIQSDSRGPRRPPLQNQKPQANVGSVASGNPNWLVSSGIELTPTPPQIIQRIRDLWAVRGVDVESMAE